MRGRAVWGRARNESESKTAPILALGHPDGKTGLRRSGRPRRGRADPKKRKCLCPRTGMGPPPSSGKAAALGGVAVPRLYRGAQKKRRARIFPIHTRTPERIPQKITVSPLYKDRQRKYNDSCKARFQPLRMEV